MSKRWRQSADEHIDYVFRYYYKTCAEYPAQKNDMIECVFAELKDTVRRLADTLDRIDEKVNEA